MKHLSPIQIMRLYVRRYPFTWAVVAVTWYLSFFTPPSTPLDDVALMDKWTHLAMYGMLTCVIWWEYLRRRQAPISVKRCVVGAGVLPVAMSGVIELLQEYATTHRSGEWLDLLANTLGVTLAWLVCYVCQCVKRAK